MIWKQAGFVALFPYMDSVEAYFNDMYIFQAL